MPTDDTSRSLGERIGLISKVQVPTSSGSNTEVKTFRVWNASFGSLFGIGGMKAKAQKEIDFLSLIPRAIGQLSSGSITEAKKKKITEDLVAIMRNPCVPNNYKIGEKTLYVSRDGGDITVADEKDCLILNTEVVQLKFTPKYSCNTNSWKTTVVQIQKSEKSWTEVDYKVTQKAL